MNIDRSSTDPDHAPESGFTGASPQLDVAQNSLGVAFPIMGAVFLFFTVVGAALPVLPLQVHNVLGFGPFVVGIVAGCQFVAALISRLWAGRLADSKGAKYAVRLGLFISVAGGMCYTGSLFFVTEPNLSVAFLLVGRTLLGGAESLVITGSILWAIQLVDERRSAKMIAWVGMSMFAALAIGAPAGSFVFDTWSFSGIAVASSIIPFAALLMIAPIHAVKPAASPEQSGMGSVFGAVFWPGIGFALSGITFGAVTTFLTLLFSINQWPHGALAFAVFACMLILTRIFFGHLPDRFGGATVSIYCLICQAAGLVMIGTTANGTVAMIGAAVAGAGFSLVFPGLGIEALKRAPVERRGLAMGCYNAFLDVTLGFGSPGLGFLAGKFGLEFVFMISAVAAVLSIFISVYLRCHPVKRAL
nr:arabinose transporter [uncultured Desulfobacter sp.]